MKVSKRTEVEVDAAAIRCELAVNYGDEDIPNDFPHRKGDVWDITIDIATGQIRDWPAGVAADVYMKVVDSGCYYLLDSAGNQIAAIENDYVPKCVPGEYGDYVDFKIDAAGRITNWRADEDKIASSFFRHDDD